MGSRPHAADQAPGGLRGGGVIGHFGQLLEPLEEVVVDVSCAVTVLEPLGEGRSRVLLA
jgi:hypothetical protein